MFYLELPCTSFLSGSQDAIMQKDGGELAPRGAIKKGAIYLFFQAAFRAYQIPQYTLYIQHGSD